MKKNLKKKVELRWEYEKKTPEHNKFCIFLSFLFFFIRNNFLDETKYTKRYKGDTKGP